MSDDALIEAMARAICKTRGKNPDHRLLPNDDYLFWQTHISDATAALAAIRKTHAVVPREPTEAMREAWLNEWMGHHDHWTFGMSIGVAEGVIEEWGASYRAMLAASQEDSDGL